MFSGPENITEAIALPLLSVVDVDDKVTQEPDDNKFNFAYRRIAQFATLALKLGLSPEEIAIVFHDQDLVEKFPEKLSLPDGIDQFDALLSSLDGIIYLFKDDHYWTYSVENYNLL